MVQDNGSMVIGKTNPLISWISTNFYVTSSTVKSHLKPALAGTKDNICPNMPELMKAVANFSREDFDRPINPAQFGITTLYFRYFILNGIDWQ